MPYTLEITTRVVSYRAESCPFEGEDDHECESDCTWMDGDSRELETPTTTEIDPDVWDLDWYDGSVIAWAVDQCRNKYYVTDASEGPLGDTVPAHAWLSASSEDGYQGDARVTETTVRLIGDWTEQQRSEVFRLVVAR